MKQTRLFVLLALTACGGDDGGGGGKGSNGNVTFDSLPEAARQQFEAWKAQPIKDCAWEQAFPSIAQDLEGPPYVPSARVDHRALLASNHGSPLFVGDDGELAILGAGSPDSLQSNHTYTTNTLSVSSTLSEAVCVIELGGEELYRTNLPEAVPVYASFRRSKLTAAGVDLTAMREATRNDGQVLGALDSTPLMRHAMGALAPDRGSDAFLAKRFAISEALAAALFTSGGSSARPPDAARFVALTEATPFFPGAQIYGPAAALRPLYAGGAFQLELLYRFSETTDLTVLRVDLATSTDGKAAKATAITAAPSIPYSDAAFRACFALRGQAAAFDVAALRSPAFEEQYFGCEGLTGDGYAALAADATARGDIVRQAFTSSEGPFRGWDGALITIAQRLYAQGLELAVLGERGDPGMATVLAHWSALRDAITDAAARAAAAPAIIALVFDWQFQKLQPSDAFVASLRTALANAAPRFELSTAAMISALSFDIAPASAGGEALACASDLVGERATAVDRAIATVSAIQYSDRFVERLAGSFLQDCPSAAQLSALETASAPVKAFVASELAKDHTSLLFAGSISSVVDRALTERWTGDTFAALADVVAFGRASRYTQCLSETLSVNASCIDSSLETFSNAPGKMLAPATAARYAELARTLADRWPSLDAALDVQFAISDSFFAGMWLGCSDAGFARSRTQLLDLIARLLRAMSLDRFEIADQISTLVSSDTCS